MAAFYAFYGVSRGHRAPFDREGPLAWEGPNNSKRHPATDTKVHLGPQALTVEHPDEGDLHPRGT